MRIRRSFVHTMSVVALAASSLAATAAVADAAAARPPALTGRITYTCGFNICSKAASGAGTVTRVTTNGTSASAYAFAAASKNGAVTVMTKSGTDPLQLWIKRRTGAARPQAKTYWGSPLGFTRVNAAGTEARWNEFAFVPLTPYLIQLPLTATEVDGDEHVRSSFAAHVGFGRGGTVVQANSTATELCEVPAKRSGGTDCLATIAKLGGTDRTFGAVSELTADGKLLVTESHTITPEKSYVSLFDVATGALVRHLTTVGDEWNPSFSPDGKHVVYACGKHVCTRPIAANGKQKVLIRNASYPTWSK